MKVLLPYTILLSLFICGMFLSASNHQKKKEKRRRGKEEKRNEGRKEKNTNTSLVAWGLSVESVTYSIHTVQVDNNNNFKAALFSFSFDQGLLGDGGGQKRESGRRAERGQ